jgi:DNA-binding NarL/FixJ family response regulator
LAGFLRAAGTFSGARVVIRVLLVDDQHLMRVGFRMILDAEPDIEVVGEAADGAEAVNLAHALVPDVVLMDVRMPGMDGVEATRLITRDTDVRVLILTTFDIDAYAFDGMRNGASGFLLKDVLPETLSAGIRAVAEGDAVMTPRITRQLLDRYLALPPADQGRPAVRPRAIEQLTAREREVFDLVCEGLSNNEIAGQLFLSEATVKTHITRILMKLALRDRVQAVIYAYENGLRRP